MERCYLIVFTLPAHVLLQAPAHRLLPNLTSNNLSFPSLYNAFLPISYQRTRKQKILPFLFFLDPYHLIFFYPLFPYIPFFIICIHTHADLFVLFSFTLANWIIIFKELFFSFFFSIHHHQAHLHHIFNLYTPLLHLAYPSCEDTHINHNTHSFLPYYSLIFVG